MDNWQKVSIALLFLIFVGIFAIYLKPYPISIKETIREIDSGDGLSTGASTTVLDLQTVRAYFNVSSGYTQINGNTSNGGTSIPNLFLKGKIFAIFVNSSPQANASVILMDPFNDRNGTLFTFFNGTNIFLTGVNLTRELGITYYGNLRFNVTGGGPVQRNNGTMIFVDILYQGVS